MIVGEVILLVGAVVIFRATWPPGSPADPVCLGPLFFLLIISGPLFYGCWERCGNKPESQRGRCRAFCLLLLTLLLLVIALLYVFCRPPGL